MVISGAEGRACAIDENHVVSCWGEFAPEVPDGEYLRVYVGEPADMLVCTEDMDHEVLCWNESI